MKILLPIALALVICGGIAVASHRQQSDFFTLNAGLTKSFEDTQKPTSIAFSRDGALLATVDEKGVVSLHKVSDGSVIGTAPAHKPGKSAVAISPLGDSFASWGQDQQVILWDATVKQTKVLVANGGKPGTMAFSGDGTRVACGADDGTIRVFNAVDGSQVASYKAHSKPILALAFEPSGRTIVTLGADRNMKTSDAVTGQILKEKFLPQKIKFDAKPEDEFQQIHSASCTPDGSLFAIGGYNFYRQLGGMPREYEFVILYDRAGRRLLRINDPNSVNMSLCVSITPDGKLVGTSAPDGKMRVWDVQRREKAVEQTSQGSIKATAATKVGDNYLFAVAGKTAGITAVTPTEPDPTPKGEEAKVVKDGLSIEFANPLEGSPIVSSPNLEITAKVDGLSSAPKWTIDVAGHPSAPVTLTPSDNRDLIEARDADPGEKVGKAQAVKIAPGTVSISQNLQLSEGPNRIRVTVQDGDKRVTAIKTICYVPDGESVDKSKVYSNSFAVIVGVNKYTGKSGKNIPALTAATADAEALAKVLKDNYGFRDVALLTDANATKAGVMKALNRLTDANIVHPNDRVVVFWSGHGQTVTAPEGGQIGFLLPTDASVDFTNLDNIRPYRETCVPMDELAQLARDIPAKHVLFLVDACFSGIAAAKGNVYPPNTFGLQHQAYFDAKQIITASSRFEPAKERNGHGYFTKALLDTLEDPAADENKDGYLTASELYKALTPRVQTMNTSQSPRMAKFSTGVGETLFFK